MLWVGNFLCTCCGISMYLNFWGYIMYGTGQLKCDGTRAETRFRLSSKRMSPFKSARASLQSTTGSRGVRISDNNAGHTTFRGSVRVLATHSIRQIPLHFPSLASPFAIRFQMHSTYGKEPPVLGVLDS